MGVSTTAEPPYRRIVEEIRGQIAAGELGPGDRLPSTRQIARRSRVALATATKALNALRQEGLVQAIPRVGTVVAVPEDEAAPSGPARPRTSTRPEQELTRERVVRTAIEIADSEGLDAVSMRAVAARLGAATMSMYRHVASKDELVLLMADAAFAEQGYAEPPPAGWRARIELAARTLWTLYRRHPWLAQLNPLTRPLPLPSLLLHGEWILAALDELGFEPAAALDLEVVLYSHIQGLAANLEREAHAQAATGLTDDEWVEQQGDALNAIARSGRYPTFAKLMATFAHDGYDLDLDKLFEIGLRMLLDGLAVLVEQRR
ncbi:TetR/AcrR family transcriptional regulator C-terminal domain-containing protein [Phytohabitans rumicis]|uniref:GntR family transcriptional regulator n=1 Tax=Phytohabitans rumicis TaxID=1076125 RepID=A0A6V8LGS6_9ACTN|nr:TetR/AcrR family transcriptional regulator C-terminal domain-containing protein [Phytohabitans rumicis]GFJ96453.1 GntR family transcriptional regulator [Phytohabitans rumicis]